MQHDLFQHLAAIASCERSFSAGKTVLTMGDPVTSFYIVKVGLVHLVRIQKGGGMVVLQRAGPGAVLAEASVFSPIYHCSAVAVTATVLQAYRRDEVQQLLGQNPMAAQAYAKHLATELRAARRRAEILALRKVADRLDAWLIWNNGQLPERGVWHHVADEIGVSKEALYRELAARRIQVFSGTK